MPFFNAKPNRRHSQRHNNDSGGPNIDWATFLSNAIRDLPSSEHTQQQPSAVQGALSPELTPSLSKAWAEGRTGPELQGWVKALEQQVGCSWQFLRCGGWEPLTTTWPLLSGAVTPMAAAATVPYVISCPLGHQPALPARLSTEKLGSRAAPSSVSASPSKPSQPRSLLRSELPFLSWKKWSYAIWLESVVWESKRWQRNLRSWELQKRKERQKRILIKDSDDGSVLEGILQNRKKHLVRFYVLYFGKETDNVYIPEDDDGVDGDDEW